MLSRKVANNRRISGLLSILVLALACASVVGCRDSQADQVGERLDCQLQELELHEQQVNCIIDSLQKLFQWEAYWTYNDDSSRTSYNEKIGKSFPITILSFRRGAIVLVPGFGNSVVMFRRSTDGNFSNPDFVAGGAVVSFDEDKLMAIASLLNWRGFLQLIGRETDKKEHQIPLIISSKEIKDYIEQNRAAIKYCETHHEITVLPLPPSYDPMDERKQALLADILRECTELVQTMFSRDKGKTFSISVPNFNISDDEIWVLVEDPNGEAYTMSLDIDLMDGKTSAHYSNTVEIRSTPKYGIRIGADEKIKRSAIRVLPHKVQ